MVRPWEMVDSIVDFGVWVTCPLCSKLEDSPAFAMLAVEESHEVIGRIAIGFLGPH